MSTMSVVRLDARRGGGRVSCDLCRRMKVSHTRLLFVQARYMHRSLPVRIAGISEIPWARLTRSRSLKLLYVQINILPQGGKVLQSQASSS